MKVNVIVCIGIFIISFFSIAADAGVCPARFGEYPLESEKQITWDNGNMNNNGESGVTCTYVSNEQKQVTCDELAKRFGCEDGVRVTRQEMRFNIFYIADEAKHAKFLKQSPNNKKWDFYCSGKSGWVGLNGDMFKTYAESFGDRYVYYRSDVKSRVQLDTQYKKSLPLDPNQVERFSKKLTECIDAYSCNVGGRLIAAGTAVSQEQSTAQTSSGEQAFGDWLKEKIFGTSEMKLDPREVAEYGEQEARRRQLSREWQEKQKEMPKDEDETAEEQTYSDWLKEMIFGKPQTPGPLNPDEVEMYGEEGAKRMQRMRGWQNKQKAQGTAEEPEPSPQAQGYAD